MLFVFDLNIPSSSNLLLKTWPNGEYSNLTWEHSNQTTTGLYTKSLPIKYSYFSNQTNILFKKW